jgi:uncharacterized Ntn-hydrolase superfamily protein
VYGPAPGFGAINAQAQVVSTANRDQGVQLLQTGVAPAAVIQQLNAADNGSASRQYGVVDLQGRVAGFTGNACTDYANHRTGTTGSYTYSVQGNILTGVAVLNQAEAAFTSQGCDLADKLMLALEAGAQNGQGDGRCINDAGVGVPANAAMIEVDLSGQTAGSYLRLTNGQSSTSFNAVAQLRTQFNTWRQTHPCMQPDAGTDAGSKDATVTDVISDGRDGGDVSVGGDASDGSAGTGGSAGQAGAAGNAGSGGTAGSSGAAGAGGTSGAAGTGGTTGGAAGTGGSAGKAGAAGTSGSGGSAGTGTGGATGTGGTGGATGGTTGSGGSSGSTAGTSSTGGRGGSSTGGSTPPSDDGCSCRIGRPHSARAASFVLAGLALISAARSRRSKRRR